MVLSIGNLPEEILYNILFYCHPSSCAALEQTARQFKCIINEPLLWRFYCQSKFRFWDPKHDLATKLSGPASAVNWKALYILRHMNDQYTCQILDSILAKQTGRIEKFRSIIKLGYDAKDALLRNISTTETDDYLARSYYSRALLACIHRSIAVKEWNRLRTDETVPLERALGAFDLFIPESGYGGVEEISSRLDMIAMSVFSRYPDIDQFTPRHKAMAIASCLRGDNLMGIGAGREYHSLEHNFLGVALNDSEHNSLPLISAAIYCYVAQRLGLNARPCGFPFHVHVIVKPPRGIDVDGNILRDQREIEPIYMDPFRSDRVTPVTELQSQLNFLGASTNEQSTFLKESLVSEIVLRSSNNILNSVRRMSHFSDVRLGLVDIDSAKYAAVWSAVLLTDPSQPAASRHHLPWLMELFATEFPSDAFLIEEYVAPLFLGMREHDHILESLHVMRAVDEMPKQIKRRALHNGSIKYQIGQVFRHRRYDYKAVITGWDIECDAGDQWVRQMGIDRLQHGRHQSFYHVLVEDRSVRYVAEENIDPMSPPISELPVSLTSAAGKHFRRWDTGARRFVSNIRDEYPDD